MIFGKYGPATADDMAEYLGLPSKSQFPDEGLRARFVQKHIVWVAPKSKSMKLRCMTICLYCQKDIPVGRIVQHEKIMHPEEWVKNSTECRRLIQARLRDEEALADAHAALAPTGAAT